jgi:hypothetical protein
MPTIIGEAALQSSKLVKGATLKVYASRNISDIFFTASSLKSLFCETWEEVIGGNNILDTHVYLG